MKREYRLTLLSNLILGLIGLCLCVGLAGFSFFLGRQTAATAAALPPEQRQPAEQVIVPTQTPSPAAPIAPTSTPDISDPMGEIQEPSGPTRTPMPPMSRDYELQDEDIELLFEVWENIIRDFDGELPTKEDLLYGAINGSLDELNDEFTRFIPPAAAARMREDMFGSFEGIGALVRMSEDGYLQIVRPYAGQPAAQAGLRAEDIVLEIDGESTQGMTVDEAVSRVRGPRGTPVTLTISRTEVEEPFEVTIVRQLIEIPTVESELLPDGIGYVRLSSFNRVATEQLDQAVSDLLAQNPRALVFDLRDNPGGFLDQAVSVADIFLPEGVVLYERSMAGLDETFRSQTNNPAEDIPLVVLINPGSASASELVAGAIQDRERGIVIGETSFGKGSVQLPRTLSDGSELRVTIARWYTPNNRSIDQVGVIPDIEVTPSPLEFGGPGDTQLQRAIEYILTGQ
jgi:carboxyl-terminal processing protease